MSQSPTTRFGGYCPNDRCWKVRDINDLVPVTQCKPGGGPQAMFQGVQKKGTWGPGADGLLVPKFEGAPDCRLAYQCYGSWTGLGWTWKTPYTGPPDVYYTLPILQSWQFSKITFPFRFPHTRVCPAYSTYSSLYCALPGATHPKRYADEWNCTAANMVASCARCDGGFQLNLGRPWWPFVYTDRQHPNIYWPAMAQVTWSGGWSSGDMARARCNGYDLTQQGQYVMLPVTDFSAYATRCIGLKVTLDVNNVVADWAYAVFWVYGGLAGGIAQDFFQINNQGPCNVLQTVYTDYFVSEAVATILTTTDYGAAVNAWLNDWSTTPTIQDSIFVLGPNCYETLCVPSPLPSPPNPPPLPPSPPVPPVLVPPGDPCTCDYYQSAAFDIGTGGVSTTHWTSPTDWRVRGTATPSGTCQFSAVIQAGNNIEARVFILIEDRNPSSPTNTGLMMVQVQWYDKQAQQYIFGGQWSTAGTGGQGTWYPGICMPGQPTTGAGLLVCDQASGVHAGAAVTIS